MFIRAASVFFTGILAVVVSAQQGSLPGGLVVQSNIPSQCVTTSCAASITDGADACGNQANGNLTSCCTTTVASNLNTCLNCVASAQQNNQGPAQQYFNNFISVCNSRAGANLPNGSVGNGNSTGNGGNGDPNGNGNRNGGNGNGNGNGTIPPGGTGTGGANGAVVIPINPSRIPSQCNTQCSPSIQDISSCQNSNDALCTCSNNVASNTRTCLTCFAQNDSTQQGTVDNDLQNYVNNCKSRGASLDSSFGSSTIGGVVSGTTSGFGSSATPLGLSSMVATVTFTSNGRTFTSTSTGLASPTAGQVGRNGAAIMAVDMKWIGVLCSALFVALV